LNPTGIWDRQKVKCNIKEDDGGNKEPQEPQEPKKEDKVEPATSSYANQNLDQVISTQIVLAHKLDDLKHDLKRIEHQKLQLLTEEKRKKKQLELVKSKKIENDTDPQNRLLPQNKSVSNQKLYKKQEDSSSSETSTEIQTQPLNTQDLTKVSTTPSLKKPSAKSAIPTDHISSNPDPNDKTGLYTMEHEIHNLDANNFNSLNKSINNLLTLNNIRLRFKSVQNS